MIQAKEKRNEQQKQSKKNNWTSEIRIGWNYIDCQNVEYIFIQCIFWMNSHSNMLPCFNEWLFLFVRKGKPKSMFKWIQFFF